MERGEIMEKFYSCEEIADHFQVKVETVWEWIKARRLAAIRVGRGYRIPESAVREYEQRNKV